MKELEVLEQQKALWQRREKKETYNSEYENPRIQDLNSNEREQRSGCLRTPIQKLIEVQTPY